VGAPDFTVSATASSGLAILWGVSGQCSNPSGTIIHLTAVVPGGCTVTAYQFGDTNWNAATNVPRSFNILADADLDQVADVVDNCPLIPNSDQLNTDAANAAANRAGADALGDACDDDIDGDGYTDTQEAALGRDPAAYCPIMRADVDGDGVMSVLDLAEVAKYYTVHIPPAPELYNQDADNQISILDLGIMAVFYTQHVTACQAAPLPTATATSTPTSTATPTDTPTTTPGAANHLSFTTQPSASGAEAAAFAAQPVVKIQDANGNTVATGAASTASVTLAVTGGTGFGGGGAIACTTNPVVAVAGVATFTGCNVAKAGIGYTITATSSPAFSPATSTAFNITPVGAAASVAFITSPSLSTVSLVPFAAQPVAMVKSAAGGLFWTGTGSAGNVTLAILTNPSAGTLACTAPTVMAANGLATWAGCNVDKAGVGYALKATLDSPALVSGASGAFTITHGAAAKLAINQPGNGVAGVAFAPQPIVTVQDASGNTVDTGAGATSSITLVRTIITGTGVLENCTANPLAATAGVATFAVCDISLAGTYTIMAAGGSLTPATTGTITIS
jgi:hypothetical protein